MIWDARSHDRAKAQVEGLRTRTRLPSAGPAQIWITCEVNMSEQSRAHSPTSTEAANRTIANQTRTMAECINHLGHEVVACFGLDDPHERTGRMLGVGTEIEAGMLPVIGWLERQRSAETAELVRLRLYHVLQEAMECSRLEIPEYRGGVITPDAGRTPSQGARQTAVMVVTAMAYAQSLREWANKIEQEEQTQRSPAPAVPTIWHHGDRSYSRDRINPIVVTYDEDNILQTFLDSGKAMDTREVANKSGVSNVSRTIGGLCKKYAGVFVDAIRTPHDGKKGTGGYFIFVRNLDS